MCGFQSQLLVLGVIGDLLGVGRVSVRIIEQAGKELGAQGSRHRLVERRFGNVPCLDLFQRHSININVRQFEINAGFEGLPRSLFFAGGDVMARFEFGNREVIRNDEALKAPLFSEHVIQEPVIGMRRHAVNLVIRSHHAHGVRFGDSGFKGHEKGIAQDALRIIRRADVGAAFGLAVRRKMFRSGKDVGFVNAWATALKAVDAGDAEARD